MHVSVAVLGSGLQPLLLAWVLSQHPAVSVFTVELGLPPPPLGFDEAQLATPAMLGALNALGVPHSLFRPRRAACVSGRLLSYTPKVPAHRMVRFDGAQLLDALKDRVREAVLPRCRVEPLRVATNAGAYERFDFVVLADGNVDRWRPRFWCRLPELSLDRFEVLVQLRGCAPLARWEWIRFVDCSALCHLVVSGDKAVVTTRRLGEPFRQELRAMLPLELTGAATRQVERARTRDLLPEHAELVEPVTPLGNVVLIGYELLRRWTVDRRR